MTAFLEGRLPIAQGHVGRQYLDAVTLRILHQLRRRIKPQRQTVQQTGQKSGRLIALQPRAEIDEQRETRGMTLWKTVFAEALDLFADAVDKSLLIAAR